MVKQKAALERLWDDRCTVVIRQEETDQDTKITNFRETILYQDQPCRLSFQTLSPAGGAEVAAAGQTVTLFLSSEPVIPAGSRIVVTHQGRTMDYASSGEPGLYTHHQEIRLEKFRGWA